MSEPKTVAKSMDEVMPGLFHWQIRDERIHHVSDAYAVVDRGKAVLIDPLPLDAKAFGRLGAVEAIVIASPGHQRSAWTFRKMTGAKVYAPQEASGLDEKPDVSFQDGERLPGALEAAHAPGPGPTHHALLMEKGSGVLFLTDVVMNEPGKGLMFLPDKYMDDPARARRSVRRLLERRFSILCFGHGAPLQENGRQALSDLLKADSKK